MPCKISCQYCGSLLFDEGRNTVLAFPPTFNWGPSQMPGVSLFLAESRRVECWLRTHLACPFLHTAELKGKDHIFYGQVSAFGSLDLCFFSLSFLTLLLFSRDLSTSKMVYPNGLVRLEMPICSETVADS